MSVYAFYTPFVASPVNDQRAGTYRVGSDSPMAIQIVRGADTVLRFAFRTHNHKVFQNLGRTITGKIYNHAKIQLLEQTLLVEPLIPGAAKLVLGSSQTQLLIPGFYNLVLEVEDEFGLTTIAQTNTRSMPRFAIDVIE